MPAIKCPRCSYVGIHTVIDTRSKTPHHAGIRRRRQCAQCAAKFTTLEITQDRLRLLERTTVLFRSIKQLFNDPQWVD